MTNFTTCGAAESNFLVTEGLPKGLSCVLNSSGGSWRDINKVVLHQLDVSLLCQLWSLHEDIQEFQNSSLLSEVLFGADNGYSEEEREVEEEDMEETLVSQCPLPPLSSNTRDQWSNSSFHVP